jgi:PAS domain S-box-containing protein
MNRVDNNPKKRRQKKSKPASKLNALPRRAKPLEAARHRIKQAKEVLGDWKKKLGPLFELLPVGISILDANRNVTYINSALKQMLGLSEEDLRTSSYLNRKYLNAAGDPMPADGFAGSQVLKDGKAVYDVETGVVKEDGTIVWMNVSAGPIDFPDGKIVIVASDITARKQREAHLSQLNRTYALLLHESEQRYQILAKISPVGIFRTNPDGATTYVNAKWCEMSGLSVDEALGQGWLHAVHPDDRETLGRGWQASTQLQEASSTDYRFLRPDGTVVWVMGQAIPEKNSENKIIGYIGTVADITARKLAEMETARANRSLRMLNSIDQALILSRDESTMLNEVCRIAVDVGGYRMAWIGFAEQDAAKTVRPVAHAGFESGFVESIHVSWADDERGRGPGGTAIRTGQISISHNIPSDPAFTPWREEASQHGYNSCIGLPLIRDGKTHGMLAIYSTEVDAFDAKEVEILKELADNVAFGITALRTSARRDQAEEALRTSQRQLSLIYENTFDILFYLAVEPEGRFRFVSVNSAFLRATGLPEDQIVGKLVQEVIPESSHALVLGKYNEALRTKKTVSWEEVSVYPAGKKYGQVSVTPILDTNEKCAGLIGTLHDITDFKSAEEAIRTLNIDLEQRVNERTVQLTAANKELESFSYSVSHDLRAPLRAISGFASIIARRHRADLNNEGQHYVDNIVQASAHMGLLIDDLLTYSRLGREGVRHVPVPLASVMAEIRKNMQNRLDEVHGTIEIAEGLPSVIGDQTLVRQIFLNLLENAITYHKPDMPPKVAVTWHTKDDQVIVQVRDNGIGISAEYYEKIFNMFQRLHSEDEYPGTGIGLANVKKSVGLLGGSVWVESKVGEGSTFCVRLTKS